MEAVNSEETEVDAAPKRPAWYARMFGARFWVAVGIIFLCAMVLVGAMERMQRAGFAELGAWAREHPGIAAANVGLCAAVLAVVTFLLNNVYVGASLGGAGLLVLGLVNGQKLSFLTEPLLPWDLAFAMQVGQLWAGLGPALSVTPVVVIVLAALSSVYWQRFLPRLTFHPMARVAMCALALGLLTRVVFCHGTWVEMALYQGGIVNYVTDQRRTYEQNGFALSFAMNSEFAVVSRPRGYGAEAIDAIADRLVGGSAPTTAPAERPDVIVVMNEAFWDPTLLPRVSFTPDPMVNFRWLRAKHGAGWMLSPTFIGGTANVEFELLTGYSNALLPAGSVPYEQYIKRPLPSLASVFAENGYRSLAIHPYYKWFWNRERVYRHLGFTEFVGMEAFDPPTQTRGLWVSDQAVTDMVIQRVQSATEPLFLFAITMQNHGPYAAGRYPSSDVTISSDIPAEKLEPLALYTQGVYDGDQALRKLMDYLEARTRPTVLIFFGDHLPHLGPGAMGYVETGFVSGDPAFITLSRAEQLSIRKVPVLVWANFGPPERLGFDTFSPNLMARHVLRLAGIQHPFFVDFLGELEQVLPALTRQVQVRPDGRLSHDIPDSADDVIQRYRMIQYDMLFGQAFARERLFGTGR